MQEGFDMCDDGVSSLVQAKAMSLKKAGATVEKVSIPLHKDGNKDVLYFERCSYYAHFFLRSII